LNKGDDKFYGCLSVEPESELGRGARVTMFPLPASVFSFCFSAFDGTFQTALKTSFSRVVYREIKVFNTQAA
jgi:hypothetical protein